jgi:Ca2+/Na+ antiporter
METTVRNTVGVETTDRPRRYTRPLLGVALFCFALPFLTVTCYGDDVTVNGVQAVSTVTPSSDPGDRQFAGEHEPPNPFAIAALVATIIGIAKASERAASRRTAVWAAAAGAVALEGLYLYAFYRTQGWVLPAIGFTAAIALLVAAAWTATGGVPRWVWVAIGGVALGMIPYSLLRVETQMDLSQGFLGSIAGGIVAVCLAVGAVAAAITHDRSDVVRRFRPARMALAGIVGCVLLSGAAFAGFAMLGQMLPNEYDGSSVESSVVFAMLVLILLVGASALAWALGGWIVHGARRGRSPEPLAAPAGVR